MAILGGWRLTRAGALFFGGVIILGALLIGAIYLVTQQAEQARRAEEVKIAEQNLQDQSQPVAVNSDDQSNNQSVQEGQGAASSDTELPQTGGELQALLAVAALTVATTYYLTSYRAVRQHGR